MSAGREKAIGRILRRRGLSLAVAESCTGGLLAHRITQVPGSSDYFLGGIVAYGNRAKVELLSVREKTLAARGAVSRESAAEMARGVRRRFRSDMGLSITGVAGPGGGSVKKPTGLVYIGLATGKALFIRRAILPGTRSRVKAQASRRALDLLYNYLCGRP